MPFRLIGSIILLVIVTIFCGFNLGDSYKSDLNLLFHTFHAVPVFLIVLGSFFAGCIVVLPFTFGKRKKARKIEKKTESQSEAGHPEGAETASSEEKAPVEKKSPFAAAREASRARREKTLAEKAEKKAKREAEKVARSQKKKSEENPGHSENDVPVIK